MEQKSAFQRRFVIAISTLCGQPNRNLGTVKKTKSTSKRLRQSAILMSNVSTSS